MEREDFKNYFAYTLDGDLDWDITLKEGEIIDDCSIKLNTIFNKVGEDFQLIIKTAGEEFVESHQKTTLENDIFRFIKLNNEYKVDVKIVVNFNLKKQKKTSNL